MALDDFIAFVNREIPRRPVMLTVDLTSYDGDPNAPGAPSIVQSAPKGTFYLRDSTEVLYQKGYSTPGTYRIVGSGGPGPGPASNRYYNIYLIGDRDGVNKVFTTPQKFINGTEAVYRNGLRSSSEDYITAESGGFGTGYDTVIFVDAPVSIETLLIDYSVVAPVEERFNVIPTGDKDGTNKIFTTPEPFILGTECVFWNGSRMIRGVDGDYIAEESGGPGSGYDTIVLSVAPIIEEPLMVDYETNV